MQDPVPENIHGEKVQQHSFEHRVNWGYVILGIAALYATWKFTSNTSLLESDEEESRLG